MAVSKKAVCKGDVFLITALLLLALGLFLWFTALPVRSGATAVVEIDGDEVARYELSRQTEERIVELGGAYRVQLRLAPGEIAFYHSGCPDQTCVRTGTLRTPGQVAVCLPARVSVRIVGEEPYEGMTG